MKLAMKAAALALALGLMTGIGRDSVQAKAAAQPAQPADTRAAGLAVATFAGGCFWSMERAFDKLPGVVATTSGYTGGDTVDPTYEEVSAGGTGHAESVQVQYDPARIGYAALLDAYWHNIDPLTPNRQFCDAGAQYRSAIYYSDDEQRRLAERSRAAIEESGRFDAPVVTQILPASAFYPAEAYHQDFHEMNPVRYQLYRSGCGRDRRLEELWGG